MKAIRTGIARNLAVIPDLQVSAYMLSNPTPPAVHVLPDTLTFDLAMRGGLHELAMMVQVFVSTTSDVGAQVLLDQYLAPTGALSLKAAIEADRTLGGAVQDTHVQMFTYRQYPRPEGEPFLGADFTVQVYA
jgi:hypothetical protein